MANDRTKLQTHLQAALPSIIVRLADNDLRDRPSVFDGPVLKIGSASPKGYHFALHCDEGDDIDALAQDVYHAMPGEIDCSDDEEDGLSTTLLLLFRKMEPLLDDADFRCGEMLIYQQVYHSTAIAAE